MNCLTDLPTYPEITFLVPIHEMDDLQISSDSSLNHESKYLKNNDWDIFKNENIIMQTMTELQEHVERLFRERSDQKK